jgi:hypothetical protein
MKSGSLSLLEPSGPVQACNEIALPFNICNLYNYKYISSKHFAFLNSAYTMKGKSGITSSILNNN